MKRLVKLFENICDMKSKWISIFMNFNKSYSKSMPYMLGIYIGAILLFLSYCRSKGIYSEIPMLIASIPCVLTISMIKEKDIGKNLGMKIITTQLYIFMAVAFIVVFFLVSREGKWCLYSISLLFITQMVLLINVANKPYKTQILKMELRKPIVNNLGTPSHYCEGAPCYIVDIKLFAHALVRDLKKDPERVAKDFVDKFVDQYYEVEEFQTAYICFGIDYDFDNHVNYISELSGLPKNDLMEYLLIRYGLYKKIQELLLGNS